MNDQDLHAVTPPAAAARRRLWPWVLLGVFVLLTALVVLAIVGAVATIDERGVGSISISIDGETLVLPALHGGALVAALVGVAVALVLALVAVPLVLLAAFGAAGLGIACVMVALVGAVALAASPLLLGAALFWWWRRSARRAPAAPGPTAPSSSA